MLGHQGVVRLAVRNGLVERVAVETVVVAVVVGLFEGWCLPLSRRRPLTHRKTCCRPQPTKFQGGSGHLLLIG